MTTDRFKAFWLGLFIIIALGLAAWLILFLKPSVGDGKVLLTVRFSNIDKITEGSLVTFGGRPVGEVVEIREIEDPREAAADSFGNLYIYELKLRVDSSVKLYTYDEITFATSGLLGEKSIAIVPKAAPPGALAAVEVTDQILYARSTDKLDETLSKLTNVAGTLNDTLNEVTIFIETNNQGLNRALTTLSHAGEEMLVFIRRANESDLVGRTVAATENLRQAMMQAETVFASVNDHQIIERLGGSFDSLFEAASLFSRGNGTIARLMNSDSLYVQLSTLVCQLKEVLNDINHYGLLYQFDRNWQRSKNLKKCQQMCGSPAGLSNY